jgi:hypothetical protein
VRLREGEAAPAFAEQPLVGVDHVGLRPNPQGGVDAGKRVRHEQVIVVEHRDELAPRHLQRGIGGDCDSTGVLAAEVVDARVGGGCPAQCLADLGVAGAIVHQTQLPVLVGLRKHRVDGLFEDLQGWVVDRGEDRESRLP